MFSRRTSLNARMITWIMQAGSTAIGLAWWTGTSALEPVHSGILLVAWCTMDRTAGNIVLRTRDTMFQAPCPRVYAAAPTAVPIDPSQRARFGELVDRALATAFHAGFFRMVSA